MSFAISPLTKKIFVSYRTRLVPGVEIDFSGITAPANYKDPAKIEAYVQEKKADMLAAAGNVCYTGTFEEVHVCDPASRQLVKFAYRDPASGRQPVSQALRAFFLKTYPKAWDSPGAVPEAIIVGFRPRDFIKMLGTECSLPEAGGNTMPLAFWHGNTDHRDIEEAVRPEFNAGASWATILKRHKLHEDFAAWPGPGRGDPALELRLIVELAVRIGMIPRPAAD